MPSLSFDVTARAPLTSSGAKITAIPPVEEEPVSGPVSPQVAPPVVDAWELSSRGLRGHEEPQPGQFLVTAHHAEPGAAAPSAPAGETAGVEPELTSEEQAQVRELRTRDREVRAHEQAHKSAAGGLATGGPSYQTERGPDGVDYAVGGEVGISVSEGNTPRQTIERAERARRAALAPAQPSGQDRAVAAQAQQMAARARAELRDEAQAAAAGYSEVQSSAAERTTSPPLLDIIG